MGSSQVKGRLSKYFHSLVKGLAVLAIFGSSQSAFAQEVTSATVSPSTYTQAGTVLTFTINGNTGSETLVNPAITTSSNGLTYACSPTSGGTNSNFSCTSTYTTQAGDVTPGGQVTEVATATNRNGNTTLNISGGSPVMTARNVSPQTINFANPGDQLEVGTATRVTLSATATSGLTVAFTSNTTSVCDFNDRGSLFFRIAGTCTVAANQAGNASYLAAPEVTQSFQVTFADVTPPVITLPDSQTLNAPANAASVVFNYSATALDDFDGAVTPTLVSGLASGSAFPIGDTLVTWRAEDSVPNVSTKSFTITVADVTAPVIGQLPNIEVNADPGASTAVVSYPTPTATDNSGTVTSGPTLTSPAATASGSAFPIGQTTVSYQATDPSGNTGTMSFVVLVQDRESPVISGGPVGGQIALSTPANSDVASFDLNSLTSDGTYSATDNVSASPSITYEVGGAVVGGTRDFPVGATNVNVFATDTAGNKSLPLQLVVNVTDNIEPVVVGVANTTVEAGPGDVRSVAFATTASDNVDGTLRVTFALDGKEITSPFDFAVGTNTVTASARDQAGNTGTTTFDVVITTAIAPNAPVISTARVNQDVSQLRSLTVGGTAEADSEVTVVWPDNTTDSMTATGGTYEFTSANQMIGGTVSVTATDEAQNVSGAATVNLFPDYDNPTVIISGAPTRVIDVTPFVVDIAFNENVIGFEQADISVMGATITSFGGSAADYSAEITPIAGETTIEISIAAGVAEDDFTNPNEASNVITITNDALTETEQLIVAATADRARSSNASQPRLTRLMRGGTQGSAMISATQGAGIFDFSTSAGRNVWAEGQGRWSKTGDAEAGYANLSFGAHADISETLMVGGMLQVDQYLSEEGDASFKASGIMFGPYAVARLPEQPLMFSASYLFGQSSNEVSPLGTYEDSFDSERSVATLGVAGEFMVNGITLLPLLDVIRSVDESDAYTDGDSNPVRSQTVTLTDINVGLDVEVPVSMNQGDLLVLGGFGMTGSQYEDAIETSESSYGNVSLGFRYTMENGGSLSGKATYDGLGDDDFEAIGGSLMYEIRF